MISINAAWCNRPWFFSSIKCSWLFKTRHYFLHFFNVLKNYTCAIPVTDKGTPCIVYTFGEETLSVMTFRFNLCTFWMHGMTKAQPPTTIRGWLWKTPETTMASFGPPVIKPIRHMSFFPFLFLFNYHRRTFFCVLINIGLMFCQHYKTVSQITFRKSS